MNNLVKRTLSGTGFALVMMLGLLVNQHLFAALIIFMIAQMMHEFFRMSMGEKYKVLRIITIIAGIYSFVILYLHYAYGVTVKFVGISLIVVILIMIASVFSQDKENIWKTAYLYTGLVYVALPLSLSNIVAFRGGSFNATLLISFFILICCSDMGAYAFGMAFGQKEGRRKLAPKISPKKSWMGFWGGLLFCVVTAVGLHFTKLLNYPMIHCIILAVLIHCGGVCGDLFESMWKRQFGYKDSGNVIPGHGGLLDRFDSTLLAVPLGVLYLSMISLF